MIKNILKASKLIDVVSYFVIITLFIILSCCAVFSELINFEKDTSNLTNYGFAILLGLSSVCFSWARNLTGELAQKWGWYLNYIAIQALTGSILFLMGSGFKYFAMKNMSISIISFDFYIWFRIISGWCFLLANTRFISVVDGILKMGMAFRNSE